ARAIIADARKIVAPQGIEELREVEIGGIKQWISVRGRDRRNPILLFIHGGPGYTEMPIAWLYQKPWEDYFTVVQWDQRAAGKTAAANHQAKVLPTVTIERMTRDGEELVALLRRDYGKDKVFVLGHSWGSVIGLNLAIRRPEWLHAYIGMGQMIDWQAAERASYAFALREAQADKNAKAVAELKAIAPYPPPDGELTFDQVIVERNWVIHYGGLTANRRDFNYDLNARKLSPDYTAADHAASRENSVNLRRLLPELNRLDFTGTRELKTPVFMFAGRRDYQTPSQVVADWFERVKAPQKKLVWFEHSAHVPYLEQPGKALMHLVQDIRPIAVAAGDAAPEDRPGVDESAAAP
ncbi:MAG TPA: alpha/beta hydrolase, partial [Phenylobacterium sp.]|nr:alpha/beta hydrolase [Phenylobacterium sp.]